MSGGATASCMAAFVAELACAGVRRAVVSPGSRSTPLTLAFAAHPQVDVAVSPDERRAGFWALGAAKVGGYPVAVVCTSGTAAANLHPAVVEADHAGIPLVVCTTDRPPELHGRGATQTVEQSDMFGTSVRIGVDAGLPGDAADIESWFRLLACRIAATATAPLPGPVHVNLPLRPPLDVGQAAEVLPRSFTVVHDQPPGPPGAASVEGLAAAVRAARRGLLVCGWTPPVDARAVALRQAVAAFAAATGWPVVAEAASQVRFGTDAPVVAGHDLICRAGAGVPDVVVRVGGWPVSTALAASIAAADVHVHLAASPGWSDPDGVVTDRVTADAAATLTVLAAAVGDCRVDLAWLRRWREAGDAAQAVLEHAPPGEGAAVAGAAQAATGAVLCVGASMPLRDVDTYALPGAGPELVVANRGANGIDGFVSTAAGAAWASGRPVVAVCGDVTFAHDGLALADAVGTGVDFVVVVIDNAGGGIFSFLPQARMGLGADFDRYFATPPGLDLAHLAAATGAGFVQAEPEDVAAAVRRALSAGGVTVVAVPSDRDANVAAHEAVWREYEARTVHYLSGHS